MRTGPDHGQQINLTEALGLLRETYGAPPANRPHPAIDELIVTILSQSTADVNAERAFARLNERFPEWSSVAHAPRSEVVEAIRVGGLANVKATTIQAALKTIFARNESYDLQFLENMSNDAAIAWLTSLHGVGPKTAACVLLFSLQRSVMPVDTHVHRVSLRLGIVREGMNAAMAQTQLEGRIQAESMYDAHMLLIQHGRLTCTARAPKCGSCILASQCPSAGRFSSQG